MTDSPEKKSPLQKLYDKISQKLEKKEDTADLRAQMGSVCLELGKRDEALLHLCRALELDPNMEYVRDRINRHFKKEELKHFTIPEPRRLFWQDIPFTVAFPLAKEGIVSILVGSVLFTLAGYVPIVGSILILFFILPYLAAYLLKILNHVADGERVMPDWPEGEDLMDSIIFPGFRFLAAGILPYTPIFILLLIRSVIPVPQPLFSALFVVLLIIGTLYYPISLIAVALYESAWAPLHFPLMIRSIIQIKRDYAAACGVLFLLALTGGFVSGIFSLSFIVPFVGYIFFWSLAIYFAALQMYILGNIYYVNESNLNWF